MRPSRIIVGEVRAEECLDLLLALNSRLPGMCTLHANSARGAGEDVHAPVAGGGKHRLPNVSGKTVSNPYACPVGCRAPRPPQPRGDDGFGA